MNAMMSYLPKESLVVLIALMCLVDIKQVSAADSRLAQLLAIEKEFEAHQAAQRLEKAEAVGRRMLKLAERNFANRPKIVATILNKLANVVSDRGNYAVAELLYRRALAIRENLFGPVHSKTAMVLNNLATSCENQGKYKQAESLQRRALAIYRKVRGNEHADTADSLHNLAILYRRQGKYTEAEPLYRQALAIRRKVLGPEHVDTADSLNSLAVLFEDQGKYTEAESLHRRALAIREKLLGPGHTAVAHSLNNLAVLYWTEGRYAQTELLYHRSLDIQEDVYGSRHPDVASAVYNLALLYADQGKYSEAESLHQRALAIREKVLGPWHTDTADSLNSTANLLENKGSHREAESLYRRSLAIREKAFGPQHPAVANTLENLALLYNSEGRHAEAESLCRRSLAIFENAFGPEHPDVAPTLNHLASLVSDQGRYTEAEPLYRRSLAITERAFGPKHPNAAYALNNLAVLYMDQGKHSLAEPLYRRSLEIQEEVFGPHHPDVALALNNLGNFYKIKGEHVKAEPLIARALDILQKSNVEPDVLFTSLWMAAEIQWGLGNRSEAVRLSHQAMDLAEKLRRQSSGDERDRARVFGRLASVFELMVSWQQELGDLDAALSAIERSRARSLVDQIQLQGTDLLAGAPKAEAIRLRAAESRAKQRLASVTKQLQLLPERADMSDEKKEQERQRLEAERKTAREALVESYRQIRNASPAYRLTVGKDYQPIRLQELQTWVADQRALLLEYLVGEMGSYLLVVPSEGDPRLVSLELTEQDAQELEVEAGPVTAALLNKLLTVDGKRLQTHFSERSTENDVAGRMALLWQLLVPEEDRVALQEEKYQRLIVLPDGPLVNLPFDALVVRRLAEPQYLLDVGPPIIYGPSATLLVNLDQRQQSLTNKADHPVLSLGDPVYRQVGTNINELIAGPGTRYVSLGGQLQRLIHSGTEAQWVQQVFGKRGIDTRLLTRQGANEKAFRTSAPGSEIVHLACHGLVDQQYGNFFGALALTPQGDHADDDGFLTLPEIYNLDLKDCELAILSACDTNFGPRQKGEGVWALSRGFLVAGSRRVVASNWLVDDQAASTLVSVYCSLIARAKAEGQRPDYAAALHQAKRWLREQDGHKSPYYWGTFVLVGPY